MAEFISKRANGQAVDDDLDKGVTAFDRTTQLDQIFNEINERLNEITATNLLFLSRDNNIAIFTTDEPSSQQILLPIQHFGTEPNIEQEVLSFIAAEKINSQYFEIIQGNRFSSRIYLNSDMARIAARVRIQITDISDNMLLGVATSIVDFPTDRSITVPILFEGFYQVTRRIPLSRIKLSISVMTSSFGFQIQIISNPPTETAFISKTSTSVITEEEQIRQIAQEVFDLNEERIRSII